MIHETVSAGRVVAARAVAVLGVLVWCIALMGPIDLAVPFLQTPGFFTAYLIETGWGLLYTVLLGLPTAVLVAQPRHDEAALQVLVVSGAIAAAGVLTPELGHLVPAALGVGLVAAVRRLVGVPLRAASVRRHRPPPAAAVLVLVAVVPALAYAVDCVRAAREGRLPVDVTQELDHWPAQAAFALALLALAALCLVVDRPLVPAVSVAVATAWFGLMSVAYPAHGGSLGAVAGWAATAWAMAFGLAVVATRARRAPAGRDARAPAPH